MPSERSGHDITISIGGKVVGHMQSLVDSRIETEITEPPEGSYWEYDPFHHSWELHFTSKGEDDNG